MTEEEAHKILSNGLANAPSEHEWCMAFKMAIEALEEKPFINKPCVSSGVCEHDKNKILDKIKGYVDHIRNTGMGKKKSLEFIEKFIEGLKAESEEA